MGKFFFLPFFLSPPTFVALTTFMTITGTSHTSCCLWFFIYLYIHLFPLNWILSRLECHPALLSISFFPALSHSFCFSLFKHCASSWPDLFVSAPPHRKKGWGLLCLTKGIIFKYRLLFWHVVPLVSWRDYAGSVLKETQWTDFMKLVDLCIAKNKMASNQCLFCFILPEKLFSQIHFYKS